MTDKSPEQPPPAIIEPISSQGLRIFPHHPAWKGDPKTFDAFYELVKKVLVPCIGPAPQREVIGESDILECAFCGRGEPHVSFRDDAHTIPAGFGNRHHFTREECDACNHEHDSLDEALANYLAIERVTVGVRKREGAPKLKASDGTYVRFDHLHQHVEIVTDPGRHDSQTRVSFTQPGAFELTTHRPRFSFDDVVREMVRISWMLLPKEHRTQSPEYLTLIRGKAQPAKWQMFRFFAPGAPRLVTFQIWRARKNVTNVPSTIASFTVGPLSTVWTSCDGQPLQHKPGPLPSFDADPRFGNPSMQWLEVTPGTIQEAGSQTITMGYSENLQAPIAPKGSPPPKKNPRPRLDVEFRWLYLDIERRLTSKVHVQKNDGTRLLFGGGELAAELLVHSDAGRDSATCELNLRLANQPVANALRTLDLLEALIDPARGATIHAQDGRVWQLAGLTAPRDINLAAQRRRLEELHEIGRELEVTLTVPADDDPTSWATCGIIAAAIKSGGIVVMPRHAQFGLVVSELEAAALDRVSADEEAPLAMDCPHPWVISGVVVDVGVVQITMPAARLASRTPVERDGESMVRLEFQSELYRYVFERWLERDKVTS